LKTPKKTPEIASSKDKGSRLRTAKWKHWRMQSIA
jgi:hypothetical protein